MPGSILVPLHAGDDVSKISPAIVAFGACLQTQILLRCPMEQTLLRLGHSYTLTALRQHGHPQPAVGTSLSSEHFPGRLLPQSCDGDACFSQCRLPLSQGAAQSAQSAVNIQWPQIIMGHVLGAYTRGYQRWQLTAGWTYALLMNMLARLQSGFQTGTKAQQLAVNSSVF